MKNFFNMIETIVLILLIVCISPSSNSIAPRPYCMSKPIYHNFPLASQQILTHDMADHFSGYNLNINITSKNLFATMSPKIIELDRQDVYLANIISFYIEKKDNTVGTQSFVLYSDMSGSTHFTYGSITNINLLPQMNSTIFVTSDKNVKCFDAAIFLDHGIAIVDCVQYINKKD